MCVLSIKVPLRKNLSYPPRVCIYIYIYVYIYIYIYGPPHMAEKKQDNQLEPTYSSSVRIRDVALMTNQKWWTIGKSGERRSGISMLAAWHNGDDGDVSEVRYTTAIKSAGCQSQIKASSSLATLNSCDTMKQFICESGDRDHSQL